MGDIFHNHSPVSGGWCGFAGPTLQRTQGRYPTAPYGAGQIVEAQIRANEASTRCSQPRRSTRVNARARRPQDERTRVLRALRGTVVCIDL